MRAEACVADLQGAVGYLSAQNGDKHGKDESEKLREEHESEATELLAQFVPAFSGVSCRGEGTGFRDGSLKRKRAGSDFPTWLPHQFL